MPEPDPLDRLAPPLVGHVEPQAQFADALHSSRMHHAWLLHGPEGIGKARFAAQAAAYCVAEAAGLSTTRLDVDRDHPEARLVRQGAHPDMIWIDKWTGHDRKTPPKAIPVAGVRAALQKMQSTASYGGWRVVVVNAIDELNVEGANALLKPLEEPPRRTVLLLICHALQRTLPTIRSRCRTLSFKPLGNDDLTALVSTCEDVERNDQLDLAIALAGGRAGRALRLAEDDLVVPLFVQFCGLATGLTETGNAATLKRRLELAQGTNGMSSDRQALFFSLIEDWLSRRIAGTPEPQPLETPSDILNPSARAKIADLWSALTSNVALRHAINLDVSETVMTLFAGLDDVYSQAHIAHP